MRYSETDILRRLRSTSPDDRRVGVIMIGKGRVYTLLDDLIRVMQQDADAEVRAMAAWGLDLLGTAEAVPALVEALYDESFGVRSNAGWALVHLAARFMPEIVVADVIDVLKEDNAAHARQMAYLVLNNINTDVARAAIREYWR